MEIFRELELFLIHKDQTKYYTIDGLINGKSLLLFWSNLTR